MNIIIGTALVAGMGAVRPKTVEAQPARMARERRTRRKD